MASMGAVGEVMTARKGGNFMIDLQILLDAILEQDKNKALKVLKNLRVQMDNPTLNDLEDAIKGGIWEQAQSLFWKLVGSFLVAPR